MASLEKDGLLTEAGIKHWEKKVVDLKAISFRAINIPLENFQVILATLREFQEKAWKYDDLSH